MLGWFCKIHSVLQTKLQKDYSSPLLDRDEYEAGYELDLYRIENHNILKGLRDRFYHNVQISVTLSKVDDPSASTSTCEMDIGSEHYECKDTISLSILDLERYSETPHELNMQITADICLSDDDILASIPVPISRRIFDSALFTDVTIYAKDGARLEAHKIFLSASSSVLQAAFSNGFQESQTGKLDMPDMSEKGVRAFLRYIYYQDLELPMTDLDIAYELLYAAHKYNIFSLEAWVTAHFLDNIENITVELAFSLYLLVSNIESCDALKWNCERFLIWNHNKLESVPQYQELLLESPQFVDELRNKLFPRYWFIEL